MKRKIFLLIIIFALFKPVFALSNTGTLDFLNIPYNGQTVEIKVKYMFPVTIMFDEPILQVIWDPGSAMFHYEPKISKELKRNDITFFVKSEKVKNVGIKIITEGKKIGKLKNYSIVLSSSNYQTASTIQIKDKRTWKTTSVSNDSKKDLMKSQDIIFYNILFAHKFGISSENYNIEYINQTVKRLGLREIILESVIKENVFIQVDSDNREEIGIYSSKMMFCNHSKNRSDLITVETIKDMFPSWEKISYDFDSIPPKQCMDIFVIAKRDKFYNEFIK